MIYIAIDHINGEIDKIMGKIYNEKEANELKKFGYFVIKINLINGEVKEL